MSRCLDRLLWNGVVRGIASPDPSARFGRGWALWSANGTPSPIAPRTSADARVLAARSGSARAPIEAYHVDPDAGGDIAMPSPSSDGSERSRADDGSQRPNASWGILEAVGAFILANLVIAQSLVGGILLVILGVDDPTGGADSDALLISAVAAIVATGALWVWLRVRHPTWRAAMGIELGRRGYRDFCWGAIAALVLYPTVVFGVGSVVVLVLAALSGSPVEVPDQLDPSLAGVGKGLAVVYGIGIAPVAEEFYFRGVLFRTIADRHGVLVGLMGSGTVFGLVHWQFGEPVADALVLPVVMTVTGIGFAWIYERRRNVLASIGAHVMFNAIGLTLILIGVEA